MNRQIPKNRNMCISYSTALVIAIVSLTACSTIRKTTYPPNFVYLDNAEVHSAMQSMAISIDMLDDLLKQTDLNPEEKNRSVIEELDKLKTATDGMGANASLSSHRVISDNMGRFRARVTEARIAASSDSPDYNLSGRLVTECLSCHVKNANDNGFF